MDKFIEVENKPKTMTEKVDLANQLLAKIGLHSYELNMINEVYAYVEEYVDKNTYDKDTLLENIKDYEVNQEEFYNVYLDVLKDNGLKEMD